MKFAIRSEKGIDVSGSSRLLCGAHKLVNTVGGPAKIMAGQLLGNRDLSEHPHLENFVEILWTQLGDATPSSEHRLHDARIDQREHRLPHRRD